jgi:hypothetical protein
MKTTIKKMMLAVMVITLVSANAVAFEDSLKVKEEKSFDLTISEVSKPTQISLTDKRNNTLFSKTIESGDDFAKTFNLELLQSGEYIIEIEDEVRIKRLVLKVSETSVETGIEGQSEYFKPVINSKDNVVSVTQFSPAEKPLYVAIYNNMNELVHEETLEGGITLGKRFDFNKSQSGEYRIFLESDGNAYDHLVYVEK